VAWWLGYRPTRRKRAAARPPRQRQKRR
jgi:hypothetical protein